LLQLGREDSEPIASSTTEADSFIYYHNLMYQTKQLSFKGLIAVF
jgi:hypothetical protein